MSLPSGTLTFLFTDIEGSTRLWERFPHAMPIALVRHDQLLREVIEAHHGHVFKTVGDAFCAAFHSAPDALHAALDAHLALLAQDWKETGSIRVRIGLHTGLAHERDHDYFGPTLNRVARLQAIGHGQQTLLSQATYALVCNALPPEVTLQDLGRRRLKDLLAPEAVWQLLHPALPREFAPLKSLDYLPTNLPAQLSSFIGREKEMVQVQEWLGRTRLLTVTGSGGVGKTRLALQVAAEALERYADGVWLVELASLSDAALLAQTVAAVLQVREVPGEPITKTLLDALKDKRLLLMLDNCEHLLGASAELVAAVLTSCPQVSVLASSREALGLAGEHSYRVPSLSVPPPPLVSHLETGGAREVRLESLLAYESVRLFVDRAVGVRSDFTLTDAVAPELARLCVRLDGIPLALELAAARVRSLSMEEITARLDQRFRLLTGGSRTALPRQQTLRALIDWSYDLLSAEEKGLLHRLSVFAGGWTLAAAEGVCTGDRIEDWEVLDLLSSLVDKSLVQAEMASDRTRYRLLETVRQYARDRLLESGESDRVRERHRDCFLALAEEAEPKLQGSEQAAWFSRLEEEHENLRAALDWSLSEGAEASGAGLRLCGALCRFWLTRSHLAEGREWCGRALAAPGVKEWTAKRAKALSAAGSLAWSQGDYASARAYYEESLAIRREIGDRNGTALSLNHLGNVASYQGDTASAQAYYEESLAIRREIGDLRGIADSLKAFADLNAGKGTMERAAALWGVAEALREEIGSPLSPSAREAYDRATAGPRKALGEEAFASAWARGRAMTLEQAMAYALGESQE